MLRRVLVDYCNIGLFVDIIKLIKPNSVNLFRLKRLWHEIRCTDYEILGWYRLLKITIWPMADGWLPIATPIPILLFFIYFFALCFFFKEILILWNKTVLKTFSLLLHYVWMSTWLTIQILHRDWMHHLTYCNATSVRC